MFDLARVSGVRIALIRDRTRQPVLKTCQRQIPVCQLRIRVRFRLPRIEPYPGVTTAIGHRLGGVTDDKLDFEVPVIGLADPAEDLGPTYRP